MQTNLEIKKYLEENGITQAFISKKTGIEPSKLSLALNGGRRLTFDEYRLFPTHHSNEPRLEEKVYAG